jgi:multiple sugar transport system ATP-binding protein
LKVKLENLCKNFDSVKAVNCLNIEIEEGKLITLLGPSGCGKSTVLSLIAGLLKPSSGNIYFNDNLVNNIEPENREIGMVFQNYALYPHMTVLKNILFPLKMKRFEKKEALKIAHEMAELVHVEELLHRKPVQLSGGQQQRVAIARALVKRPKILLLDEPLSNLDARLRIEMREEIRRIQKEVGITSIFVTHDQEEAMSISDKILLMKNGEEQQYSSPKEMYNSPANMFTASFLGNPLINLLECEIAESKIHIYKTDISLEIPDYINRKLQHKLVIGMRPEDLFIDDSGKGKLNGQVVNTQIMGKEIYVQAKLGEIIVTFITSWDISIKIADKVSLNVKKIHVFDE